MEDKHCISNEVPLFIEACPRGQEDTFIAAMTTYCEVVMIIVGGEVRVCIKTLNRFLP